MQLSVKAIESLPWCIPLGNTSGEFFGTLVDSNGRSGIEVYYCVDALGNCLHEND
jgi:hypothetical protein